MKKLLINPYKQLNRVMHAHTLFLLCNILNSPHYLPFETKKRKKAMELL